MTRVQLIDKSPKTLRDLSIRGLNRTKEIIDISSQFGYHYFDGDRSYGYGGYVYDGRWKEVAQKICAHYGITKGSKVLDVGCAKGFLVKDLRDLGINAYGVDISRYAIENCHPKVEKYLQVGDARNLPFHKGDFDLVLSINTIHNLVRQDVIKALKEMMRVSKKDCFIQVDSYITIDDKRKFEEWVLTAKFHDFPAGWEKVFAEAHYFGDWDWTLISES